MESSSLFDCFPLSVVAGVGSSSLHPAIEAHNAELCPRGVQSQHQWAFLAAGWGRLVHPITTRTEITTQSTLLLGQRGCGGLQPLCKTPCGGHEGLLQRGRLGHLSRSCPKSSGAVGDASSWLIAAMVMGMPTMGVCPTERCLGLRDSLVSRRCLQRQEP